jgi:hypothetical protein
MCGAPLVDGNSSSGGSCGSGSGRHGAGGAAAAEGVEAEQEQEQQQGQEETTLRIAFRQGRDRGFYKALQEALRRRTWEEQPDAGEVSVLLAVPPPPPAGACIEGVCAGGEEVG